jgi:hypothetical protein
MSGALLDAPRRVPCAPASASPAARAALASRRPAGRGRPTLEDLLAGTLHDARTREEADCPVCHGAMHLVDGAARCERCGSTLS